MKENATNSEMNVEIIRNREKRRLEVTPRLAEWKD